MMRLQRLYPLAFLTIAAAPLGGCATMYHSGPGRAVKVEENGRQVKLVAVNLDHATEDLHIYEGDVEIPLSPVQDKIWSNAIKNSLRRGVAEGAASGCTGVCTYHWNETTTFGPGIYLNPHRPHTLRLVRGDQQATVRLDTSFRIKWYFYDMFLFFAGPIGWFVDAATGSWNEFPRLDVDRAFRNATASAGSN